MPARRRGTIRRALSLLVAILLVSGLAGLAGGWVLLTRGGIAMPGWVVAQVQNTVAAAVPRGRVSLGGIALRLEEGTGPVVELRDVVALTPEGAEQMSLPDMRVALRGKALLQGRIVPRRLKVLGARLTVTREEDGRFDLDLTGGGGTDAAVGSISDILDAVEQALDRPVLRGVERVILEDAVVTYIDHVRDRTWTIDQGQLSLEQAAQKIAMRLEAPVASDQGGQARLELTLETARNSSEARLAAEFLGVHSGDVAAQSDALNWLAVLDAPISGALRANVGPAGFVKELDGALEIGAGALQASEQVRSLAFEQGKVYFSYDPAQERLNFADISFVSPTVTVAGSGHAYIAGLAHAGAPSFLGQVRLSKLTLDPEGLLPRPLSFTTGALDFRLVAQPFRFDLGQLVLLGEGLRLHSRGHAAVQEEGWQLSLDAEAGEVTLERLLQVWPEDVVPRTRAWLAANVAEGRVRDAAASLRVVPGQDPRMAVDFDYDDATVRFLKTMPPIRKAHGHASLSGGSFSIYVAGGEVLADAGEPVDVSGSSMRIPKITQKPPRAEVTLFTRSSLKAALKLLDRKPLQVLTKAERGPDLAQGQAAMKVELSFPMQKGLDPKRVRYKASGRLSDVQSGQLVRDRMVKARELSVLADNERVQISGEGTLDGVAFNGAWIQRMGPEHAGKSRLEGTIELSPATVEAFNLGLPPGSVAGEGLGTFAVTLDRGRPPEMVLTSDLNRITLAMDALGWNKPANVTGSLRVEGALGEQPDIRLVELDAAGLFARGRVDLGPDASFRAARFERLRLDNALDVAVDLIGRGQGVPPKIDVRGGFADIRGLSARRKERGEGGPVNLALDRLVISETIALTNMRGTFSGGSGTSGTFTSGVNGQPVQIRGTVIPTADGPAFRVRSQNAGAAMAASGLFQTARDGQMELVLFPTGQVGSYDGKLSAKNIRIVNAPALAELLSAVSVVGLLEQLSGPGIHFGDVEADFRLNPRAVLIRKSSAVGASMGISMDGVYRIDTQRLDFAGVISPVYLLNGIGQILSRNREGLFGFNYRLTGSARDPKTSVNPLSILTPGFFRDIFRRPPPKVTE